MSIPACMVDHRNCGKSEHAVADEFAWAVGYNDIDFVVTSTEFFAVVFHYSSSFWRPTNQLINHFKYYFINSLGTLQAQPVSFCKAVTKM